MKVRTDEEIAGRILQLLDDRSQREMARAVGMQPSALSRALSGKRSLDMSEVVDIAGYLGVSVEDLLFEEEVAVALRVDADDVESRAAVDECLRIVNGILQIEAVGR